MKLILIGIDGSTTASAAATRAADLASRYGARLHVVCVHRPDSEGRGRVSDAERALAVVQEERARLLAFHDDITIDALPGRPAEVLVEQAADLDADLVVVGNRRLQSPLRGLGSIAGAVTHHAECDVYVVHTT
ncbi:universal stress protein [Nocardioides pantholopis]|uniref:universal stress protein n=1 Tax=Nocardioides pantholopis TaxID=2483798 RepID=UPI0013E2B64F|nr:universal stress protein [Nocardioides pantholopis]